MIGKKAFELFLLAELHGEAFKKNRIHAARFVCRTVRSITN